ncbi:hypothetical protein [Vandammella animalimorsus]|nr:hypothetical protein [Vandammella animalimorsus]
MAEPKTGPSWVKGLRVVKMRWMMRPFTCHAFGLGNIRGHWVYDVQTRAAQCIVPDDAQAWETPRIQIIGKDLVIYADLGDMRAGREARRVRL